MSTTPDAASAQVQLLLDQLNTTELKDEDRDYFRALRSEQESHQDGDSIHSSIVIDELTRILTIALPHITNAKIPGYGPVRAKYLLELGTELATHIQGHDQAMREAAGAGAGQHTNLKGSRNLRRAALRILKNLLGQEPTALTRIRKAAFEYQEKPDERARTLEALAAELEVAIQKVSPNIAADAGATPELIASLRLNAKAVMSARDLARKSQSDLATHYRIMNILDGRILFELRALLRAVRDARKIDATLPQIKSNRVLRLSKPKKPAKPAPPTEPEQP